MVDARSSFSVFQKSSSSVSPSWVDVDIAFEAREEARNMHRFYGISLRASLLSPWTVQKAWGRYGARGRVATCLCESFEEGLEKVRVLVQKRRSRPIPYVMTSWRVLGPSEVQDQVLSTLRLPGSMRTFKSRGIRVREK